MTSRPIATADRTMILSPDSEAWTDARPALISQIRRNLRPLGLPPVRLPQALTPPAAVTRTMRLSHAEARLLGWVARHPGALREAAYYGAGRHLGTDAFHAAYARLVTGDLIAVGPGRWGGTQEITPAGVNALARVRVMTWNNRHDLAAWGLAWEHEASASQRWAIAVHTGMRLLGWEYDESADAEACLLAAWDAMLPPARRYLARASLPLLLSLWDIACCGPLPLTTIVSDMRQWAEWFAGPPGTRETRHITRKIRRAVAVGLVQAITDPTPPGDQGPRELIGPAAGWTLLVPDPTPSPDMHVVEG